MKSLSLSRSIQILFFLFLVFAGLHFAKPFLVPFTIAGIFSMLFLPLSQRLEKKGISRGICVVGCILLLLGLIAGLVALISWQVADLAADVGKMQQSITQSVDKLKQFISNALGIPPEKQQQMMQQQQSSGGGGASKMVTGIMGYISGFFVDTVLMFVYIFLLMFFRSHIKKFILMLVPEEQKDNATNIIYNTTKVARQYVTGLGMVIVILWIMYGIGFSIVGVKNAIFFAILCGLLEIVPFVGNITGTSLTLLMALSQGGGTNVVIGILVTYALVQFIQTYILEPLVVGSEVNINPLFTIIVIVVGELVWGVPGMILAIPMLGIVKVICDNVEPLKPYGFLIGEEKKKKEGGMIDKIKGWFKK